MKPQGATGARYPIPLDQALEAAYQAGRAAVMHAMVNGLLATQQLTDVEAQAFFKTMRGALEKEVTNTGRIQSALCHIGIEEPANSQVVSAFQDAIKLQLRLIETEIREASASP